MSNEIDILQRLEQKINCLESSLISQKAVLTFEEAARYAGLSKSFLYKLTSTGKVPFHKPNGKMIYFDRIKLEEWLLRNESIHEEIERKASNYVTLNKKGGRS